MKKTTEDYITWDEWFKENHSKNRDEAKHPCWYDRPDDGVRPTDAIFGSVGVIYIQKKIAKEMASYGECDTKEQVIKALACYLNRDFGCATGTQKKLNDQILSDLVKNKDIRGTYKIGICELRIVTDRTRKLTKIMTVSQDKKENGYEYCARKEDLVC